MSITVRFFAAARQAAGVSELSAQNQTLSALLEELSNSSDALARIIPQCSVLVNELSSHDRNVDLHDGDVVDLLPPFAGG